MGDFEIDDEILVTGTYAKYCPNVYLAKVDVECSKGQKIILLTKYNKENKVVIYNEIYRKDGVFFYSFVRADGFDHQAWVAKKVDKFERRAGSSNQKSDEFFRKSNVHADFLVLGEPIKAGHHSERRHRKMIEAAQNNTRKSFEYQKEADAHQAKAEYWEKRQNEINLSMPESVQYYEHRLKKLTDLHSFLKDNPDKREHAYSLTYAKKEMNAVAKALDIAKKLWG